MSELAGQASEAGDSGSGSRYLAAEQRILSLADNMADDQPIAATPDWSFLDLLAHLDGVAADVSSGNVAQYAQPDWTREQVARRRGKPRDEVVAAWAESTGRLVPVLSDPVAFGLEAAYGVRPVIDVLAHEQDVRDAAGLSTSYGPEDWALVAPFRRGILDLCVRSAGLPALQVSTPEGDEWVVGGDEPAVAVRADRYDLWRSLEGRRTRTQVRGFAWTADPGPYLELWPGFVFSWPEG